MIEIKSYLGTVLHRSEADTIKAATEKAVARGADLRGAYLGGAKESRGQTAPVVGE